MKASIEVQVNERNIIFQSKFWIEFKFYLSIIYSISMSQIWRILGAIEQ